MRSFLLISYLGIINPYLQGQPPISRAYIELSGFALFTPVPNQDVNFTQTHLNIGLGYRLNEQHALGVGAVRWTQQHGHSEKIFSGFTAQYRYSSSRWVIATEIGSLYRLSSYWHDFNYSDAELLQRFSAPIVRGKVGLRFWNIFVAGMAVNGIPIARLGKTDWRYDFGTQAYISSYAEFRNKFWAVQPFVGLSFPGRGNKKKNPSP